jgi:hypothetical protein
MDIFSLREALVDDYRSFTSSFVQPSGDDIRRLLDERLASSAQWPEPWLSLNPNPPRPETPPDPANAMLWTDTMRPGLPSGGRRRLLGPSYSAEAIRS